MFETVVGRTTAGRRSGSRSRLTGTGIEGSSSKSSSKSACSTRPRYSPTFRIAPAMGFSVVRSVSDVTPVTLPEQRALPEDRTPEPKVCRAGLDGGLEVVAHARGDDARGGVASAQSSQRRDQLIEDRARVRAEWGDGHDAVES